MTPSILRLCDSTVRAGRENIVPGQLHFLRSLLLKVLSSRYQRGAQIWRSLGLSTVAAFTVMSAGRFWILVWMGLAPWAVFNSTTQEGVSDSSFLRETACHFTCPIDVVINNLGNNNHPCYRKPLFREELSAKKGLEGAGACGLWGRMNFWFVSASCVTSVWWLSPWLQENWSRTDDGIFNWWIASLLSN